MQECDVEIPNLNEEQRRAVFTIRGPVLVLAGAGSGKTRVVTYRIVHLIREGVPATEILGLTFTNKAAAEMKERVMNLTDRAVVISTFHSLGVRILRESVQVLGYRSDFTIYDEDDVEKVLKTILNEMNLPEKKQELKSCRDFITQSKNNLVEPNPISNDIYETVYCKYVDKMKQFNAVDFDDLLFLPVKLFLEHPEVLEKYQNRWKYLLIDEYQDTNHAQYTFIKMLVEKNRNLCVVGDPDQSIYSWRGANMHNILHFERDYPEAAVVRLEQNYRSVTTILDAANALIRYNQERIDKRLYSDLGEGEKIGLFAAHDEKEEAQFVAQSCARLMRRGYNADQIVVFYRTNAQSRALEDQFLSNRLAYRIIGGLSFYQRREIKDILAFLRMVVSDSDFISFLRTINMPKRGLGPTTIDKIRQESNQRAQPIFLTLQEGVDLTPKQKKSVQEYVDLILKWREKRKTCPLSELVISVVQDSGYLGVLHEDAETFSDRKENVDELIAKAFEWESEREDPTLERFLEELSLKSNLDESDPEGQKVSLMTIHNGKGLEFPVVFLVGLEETLFPHINSMGKKEAIEEERRLCYVGITRAKEKLYLSYARSRNLWGSWRPMQPSRFLREIPREYLEKIG